MPVSDYNRLVPADVNGNVLPKVVDRLRVQLQAATDWTLDGFAFTPDWKQGGAVNWWGPFAYKYADGWVSLQGIVTRSGSDAPAGTIFGRLPEGMRPTRTWIDGNVRVDPSGYCLIQDAAKVGPVALWGRFQII